MYYQDKATGEYKEMTTLLNVTSSIRVGMDEIPQYLIDATVAIEDKRFWAQAPGGGMDIRCFHIKSCYCLPQSYLQSVKGDRSAPSDSRGGLRNYEKSAIGGFMGGQE